MLELPVAWPPWGFAPPLPFDAADAERVTAIPSPRMAAKATIPGKPRPSPSPVIAGFRPIRATTLSIFRATLAMPTIRSIQGSTPKPDGT